MELNGASAIVTGGASGLGEATARFLAAQGAKVVIIDRQEELGTSVAQKIGGAFVEADVTDEVAVQKAIETAVALGPLRALVNCAGIARAARTIDKAGEPHSLKSFELVLKVNVIGTFNCTRLAAAAMAKNEPDENGERGAIINTASVAAFDGQIGQVSYSSSKGAIVAMTLPLARDLATVGVRVNTIAPGLFDTPIYGTGPDAEAFKKALGESVVFPRRLGHIDEFAKLAVHIITNGYFNGETVRLDGSIRLPPR